MEREREIEKLLKAAAEQRRKQAGEPPMHPATRETLRTEVRRKFGAGPAANAPAGSWLRRFLPKLAIVTVVVVGGWLFFGPDQDQAPMDLASMEAPSAKLDRDLPETTDNLEISAPRPEPTLEPARKVPRPTPSQEPPTLFAGPSQSGGTGGASSSVNFAAAAFEPPRRPESEVALASSQRTLDETRLFRAKSEATQEPRDMAAYGIASTIRPASLPAGMVAPTRRLAVATNVLQQFTVVRSGNEIHLIDADGSTYRGMLVPVARVADSAAATFSDRAPTTAATASGSALLRDQAPAAKLKSQLLNFDFKASGTNRSLGQNVDFKGNLVLSQNQLSAGRNAFSNTLSPGQSLFQQRANLGLPPDSNGRISGTAVIDGIENIRVEAVPVGR